MKNSYQMTGARALFSVLGGRTQQDAFDRELDRLAKLDLAQSAIVRNEAMSRKYGAEADVIDSGRRSLANPDLDYEDMAAASGTSVPIVKAMIGALRGVDGATPPGSAELPEVMRERALAAFRARLAARSGTKPANAKEMAEGAAVFGDLANRNRGGSLWPSDPQAAAGYLAAGSRQPPPALFQPIAPGGSVNRFTGQVQMAPSADALNLARAEKEQAAGRAALMRATPGAAPAAGGAVPRAPIGYRWTEDGLQLEPIPGGPRDKQPAAAGRPLPAAALKLQQDELDAIGLASGIEKDLGAFDEQIGSGALQLGRVKNWESEARNWWGSGTADANSKNYASFNATLEKLRNDSLRLNKGVQTEGDAVRAWNELIANITDAGLVRQRIAEIRAINRRAVDLRQFKIDTLRSNYGAEPLDTSTMRDQPAAIGAGAMKPPAVQAPAAETATLPRVGSEADYDALQPGAEYLDPDGNRRRKAR